MTRILDLQRLDPMGIDVGYNPLDLLGLDPQNPGQSTCSHHGCACSTNSQALCYAGGELIVI